ncbi:MAG: anaerobic ribonucleoside-triphosphate reductase activating protein [Bacilli bacterium]|nr:anaerobic ribonucleoside-triphosphate reductase activating protein [Bacilli bacterium]
MRYNTIKFNDCVNGEGLSVSLWVQGCPHHCEGCHNPETWNYIDGFLYTPEVEQNILNYLNAYGVKRNLSILGGEPLMAQNIENLYNLVTKAKRQNPEIKIIIWTGFTIEQLKSLEDPLLFALLDSIDYLIDGKFELAERNITLKWRGSPNQRILSHEWLHNYLKNDIIILEEN